VLSPASVFTLAVRDVIDFYKNSDTLIRAKSRIAGPTLQATDTDWTHSDGPSSRAA
jgi:hypothetical protein